MSKHTSGSWRVGDAGFTVFGPKNGNPAPEIIAAVRKKANSRLIAVAPELLKALDYLLEQTVDMDLKHGISLTEGETEAREKALAAIAKARGEE